ncbi:MAG TPA: mechanosensitive ion channel family protein [Mucilaginibacter sp.]|nr:mechanosensitive ion channel family protein [Mucilaginibacter sp.]
MPRFLLLPFIILFAFTVSAQKHLPVKKKVEKAPLVIKPAGEPVIIKKDTLFKFYAAQGLFDPKERARIVTKRISDVIGRLDFNPDSLVLKNDSLVSIITYRSQILMAVNDEDAKIAELDRKQLATNYLNILKKNLGIVFEDNSIKTIAINILEAITVVVLLIVLIWLVNKVFRWLKYKLLRSWEARVAQLGEKGAPIGYVNRLLPVFTSLLRVLRIFVIILLIYLALPIAFSIFPWTKPIATELLSYIIKPAKDILLGVLHYIPKLLTIIVIYLATKYTVRLVKFVSTEVENGSITIKNFYPEWVKPTYNIIKVLLYAFMFVMIFPYLPGSDSDIFKGVTVFLGILFSLGSSSAISNMVAGIVITYMRPFKIGDRVKVGDITGDVIEKNMLVTRIRTIKNEDITVPNSTILGAASVNYSSSSANLGLILHSSITIGYDAPWQMIHQLMIDAALATEGVQAEPKPFVLQTDLNDFNVTYQINAYTSQPHKMALMYSNLHQNIQDKFNEAGVEIMSPHFTALRDGNGIQIPDDYKPKDYKKPGFNMEKGD